MNGGTVAPQRILVIGGNGFVGSWAVDRLVADGHQVTVFDSFREPPKYAARPALEIAGDYFNHGELGRVLKGQDSVLHLLSSTTPATAQMDPLLDVRTNIFGGVEFLQQAVENNIQHVYFGSSGGAVYGPETGLDRRTGRAD